DPVPGGRHPGRYADPRPPVAAAPHGLLSRAEDSGGEPYMSSETAGQPPRTRPPPRLLRRAGCPSGSAPLELFVLCGLAIAQPLLDVTGKAPDFFLLHRASRGQILLLVALVVVLPPLVLWLAELAVGLVAGERARGLLHWGLVTGLLVLLAVEAGKDLLPLRGRRRVLAALVAGGARSEE